MKIYQIKQAIRMSTPDDFKDDKNPYTVKVLKTYEEAKSELDSSMIPEYHNNENQVREAIKVFPYFLIEKEGNRHVLMHLYTGLFREIQTGNNPDAMEMAEIMQLLQKKGYLPNI
jgi:hypothetical protein